MLSKGAQQLLSPIVFITALLLALVVTKADAGESEVSVLYAGSLVNLMEKDMGPAFSQATGYKYLGEGKGSVALANMIKEKLRTPDVFVSADPKVNNLLAGAENGNLVRWYAAIFGNEMVLAYNPKSGFAAELKQAGTDKLVVFQALQRDGFRLCRTDPILDPKG